MAASRMGAWAGGRWAQGGLGDFEAETNYLSERTDNPLPSLHGPSESFGQAEGRTAIAMSRDYALELDGLNAHGFKKAPEVLCVLYPELSASTVANLCMGSRDDLGLGF
ncbi:hypothetical protein AAF712_007715 [Marasmius tenuissimus]|uniref:Uncharacterized protein n=1 Tax=Marasmius tenuissimus TaxID=585030 RepID=A0ABR2ZWE2_9AGAR